jgi:signal transduction histidine kinase/PAS domain-containing protein
LIGIEKHGRIIRRGRGDCSPFSDMEIRSPVGGNLQPSPNALSILGLAFGSGSMLEILSQAPPLAGERGTAAARERQYRQLVESLPVAVYTTDAAGRIELFNEAALQVWGRAPRPGDGPWGPGRVLTASGAPLRPERCPVAKVLQGFPAAHNAELVIEAPDGRRHDVLASPRPIHDLEGRVVGAINTLVEVTARKEAEAELAATQGELAAQVQRLTRLHELAMRLGGLAELRPALHAILDTAVDGQGAHFGLVWLEDPRSGDLVVHARRGFEGAFHLERVRAGPEGGPAGNAFARGRRWVVEDVETDEPFGPFRVAARAAGIRGVHSTPIITRSGAVLGALSVHFSQPRRPSRRDEQLADVCARHAADAIEAIHAQEALRESELRQLDQRKNEFIATLAHELRNPLAPLCSGLELMRLAAGRPEIVEKARGMMERQLAQMVRLLDDLLDVSRVSRGKIELRREPVELAAVLRSAVETSEPLMRERGHELVVEVPPVGLVVDGDATRLAQVFGNLLNNAARYTEPGGRIRLALHAADSQAVVSVADNGIGIPDEMQARIFDIFTQVHRTIEKSQGGLGIGLSLAKRLVEMHGGAIEVRSAGLGRGSEFVVRLPARVAAAQPA